MDLDDTSKGNTQKRGNSLNFKIRKDIDVLTINFSLLMLEVKCVFKIYFRYN